MFRIPTNLLVYWVKLLMEQPLPVPSPIISPPLISVNPVNWMVFGIILRAGKVTSIFLPVTIHFILKMPTME